MSISGAIEDNAPAPEVKEPEAPVGNQGTAAQTDEILDALLASIKPANEVKHKRKVLIYSDPGAGKTVLSATAPKPLIYDTEDGAASINNHPELATHALVLPYKSLYQLEMIVDRLAAKAAGLEHIETFVIDTLSNLHKKGLADTVETDWKKNPNSVNRYVAETEHHTENNERIRRIVSSLNSLDCNVIINCHAKKIVKKDGSFILSPDFSDKLTNAINALVDVVGYMYEKEEQGTVNRILRLRSNGNIVAKTRFAPHPAEMVNPTWKNLFGSITAE